MRKCSPLLSVFSMTKLRNAVTFSGRVMSPSPSTPPSPETQTAGQASAKSFRTRNTNGLSSLRRFPQRTVIRLKQLARRRVEVLQFEITRPSQRHPEAFSVPPFPPQDVLWEAARPRADVAKVQKLALSVLHQGFLHDARDFIRGHVKCCDPTDVRHSVY